MPITPMKGENESYEYLVESTTGLDVMLVVLISLLGFVAEAMGVAHAAQDRDQLYR